VNRLIRVSFGPFNLGELPEWSVKEVESKALRTELGEKIVAESGANFDAPLVDHSVKVEPPRHSGARPPGREPGIQRGHSRSPLNSAPRAEPRDRNDKKRDDKKESSSSRNFKKRFQKRRDRSGGPRPARPR
jgi:23S rRNA pseudouridine2605 synthase